MLKCLEFSQILYLCSPNFENRIIFILMYAIVDIAGQQLKVEKNQKVFVNRIDAEEGTKIDFDKILLVDNDGKINVGTPTVKDMVVSATIVTHLKDDKIKVFKKKRRKGYKVLNGHRQQLTELLINDIAAGKATNKPTAKKAEKPVAKKAETKTAAKPEAKKAEKPATENKSEKTATKPATAKKETKPKTTTAKAKPAAKKETTTAKAKPATKKPAAKKPVAKKPAAKKADDSKEKKEDNK